jgi:hypothetical protein
MREFVSEAWLSRWGNVCAAALLAVMVLSPVLRNALVRKQVAPSAAAHQTAAALTVR